MRRAINVRRAGAAWYGMAGVRWVGWGALMRPTDHEDRAFWACIVIASVWAASDRPGAARLVVVVAFLAMAAWLRWPYWRQAYGQKLVGKDVGHEAA